MRAMLIITCLISSRCRMSPKDHSYCLVRVFVMQMCYQGYACPSIFICSKCHIRKLLQIHQTCKTINALGGRGTACTHTHTHTHTHTNSTFIPLRKGCLSIRSQNGSRRDSMVTKIIQIQAIIAIVKVDALKCDSIV